MEYKIIISDRAQRMLASHVNFLAKVSKKAAAEKKKDMIQALHSLNRMPNRFPFFNEPQIPPNKYHKMYVDNWYMVLYQVQDDTVYVDYIIDCRQDYSWLLK